MAHADLSPTGDRIDVTTVWNERELIKTVPGTRRDAHAKLWHTPLTWTACVQLRGIFGSTLTIGERLLKWAWTERAHIDRLIELRTLTELEPHIESDRIDDRLYPFQRVGRRFLTTGREVLLGDEMGTGKTIQTLAAIGDVTPVLVVCPNSVKMHWADSTRTWTDLTPYVVEGGTKTRRTIIENAATDDRAVIIVNFEALRTLSRLAGYGSVRLQRCRECDPKNGEERLTAARCQVHPRDLNRIPFKTVVVDEAHKIKSPSAQQTRAVWALAHQPSVHYRWGLTGTPLANHPGDVWSILHFISPRDFPTRTAFIDRYCLQAWGLGGGLEVIGLNPATTDEFYAIFDPHFRRMPKRLVTPQLPPKLRNVRWVEMTTTQAKNYRELRDNLVTMTATGPLTAPNRLVARTRLMQLASSAVKINYGVDRADIAGWGVELVEPSPKLDTLEEILAELGDRPVAVCAEHRRLIELASMRLTKLGVSHGLITGAVVPYERDLALRRFQSGELRALLFTIKSGGTGLTMTATDTLVFLQRSWSMIDNVQAEDRVHRIGSEHHESVHIIDLITRSTVEEDQVARLHEKFLRLEEINRTRSTLQAAGIDVRELDAEESALLESEIEVDSKWM